MLGTVLRIYPPTSPVCCTQALASLFLPSTCGRTLHLCGDQGTGKLLLDKDTHVTALVCEKYGNWINIFVLDSVSVFCPLSVYVFEQKLWWSVVSYPKRRSPTAECRRTTRHSGWWTPCQRWTLETSTWEGGGPVSQSDHRSRVTKEQQ